MMLQGNVRHDFNCATTESLVEILMIMVDLELEHLVLIKNVGSSSVYNPVKQNVGHLQLWNADFILPSIVVDEESGGKNQTS